MAGARATQRRAELEIDLGDGEEVGGRVEGLRDPLGGPYRRPPPMWTKWWVRWEGDERVRFYIPEPILRFFDHKTRWPGKYWGKTETETSISGFRSLIENETRKSWTKKSRPLKNARMHRYKAAWA